MSKHPAKPQPTSPARVEELRAKLGRGADTYRDLTWPGGEAKIRIRLLTRTEAQEAFAAAVARLRALGLDEFSGLDMREELQTEHTVQTMQRAICDRERHIPGTRNLCEPFFANADEARDLLLENDELSALLGVYLELKADADPDPDELVAVEPGILALVAEAQKKRQPSILRGIGISTLRNYIASMEGQQSTSPTGKSGSTSSDGNPEPTPEDSSPPPSS